MLLSVESTFAQNLTVVINHWNISLEWNGGMEWWNNYLGHVQDRNNYIHQFANLFICSCGEVLFILIINFANLCFFFFLCIVFRVARPVHIKCSLHY